MKIQWAKRGRIAGAVSCAFFGAFAAVCALPLLAATPVWAQDVKDLMGRSQSQSQQRAVEDLIKKLQGGAGAKRDGGPAPQAAPQQAPIVEPPRTAMPAPTAVPAPAVNPEGTKPQIATSPAPSPPKAAPPAGVPDREQVSSDPDVAPPTPATSAASSPPAVSPNPAVRPAVKPAAVREAPSSVPPASVRPERVDTAAIDAMPSVDIEIYFDYNSATVTLQAAATLSVLAQALTDPRLLAARFLIGGHTDAKGGADFNLELSERRAQSVRRHLIDKHGIAAGRLVAQGFGMQKPKVGSRPMDVQNRRVQVVNLTASAK